MEEKTKICAKCKRELPLSEFYKHCRTKDGLQGECKDCRKAYVVKYQRIKRDTPPNPLKACNPEFKDKTPRELIQTVRDLINELRSRGYTYEGKLTYLHTIKI